jgi:hypothetical protein
MLRVQILLTTFFPGVKSRTFLPQRPGTFFGAQAEYQGTPPGHPGSNLHYHFCRTCGIRVVGQGEHGPKGGPFYFVAIASLDDVNEDELAAAPIHYVDGKHDHYDRPPKETRLM